MPLRSRLVLLLVGLLAVALVATDAVTFTQLRSSLYSETDQTLVSIWNQASTHALGCNDVPFGFYFNRYDAKGKPVVPTSGTSCAPSVPEPRISSALARSAGRIPQFYTVSTDNPSIRYRVLFEPVQTNFFGVAVFAMGVPLTSVDSTLAHQLHLELFVSLAVLAVIALAAWALVRLSMRPLARMTRTAGEIAAGDLSKRVEHEDERTEVGQLGAALNVMLTQIEQAFRQREASEERLRRFIGDASHELRTPLTSIRGYAELFRNGATQRPEDLALALHRIESESVRMAGLVEDLLLLARLDQGRPLHFERVNLVTLARDAASDARAIDSSRTVSVSAPESLLVQADERRIRQVLANLVNNAAVHTPPGTPIELVLSKEGEAARISIVDHGPGIASEDKSHVFERFWRADRSRRRSQQNGSVGPGSGLGLSIVAAIVNAHGGRVSVDTTPGGGATFTVELPEHPPRHSGEDGVNPAPERVPPPAVPDAAPPSPDPSPRS